MNARTTERWAPVVTAIALLILWQLVCTLFKIADFTTGGGAAGPATFSNVGAIEFQSDVTVDGTDGQLTFLGDRKSVV